MFFRMVYKSGQIFRFVTIHACDRRTEFSSQRVTITCLIHIIQYWWCFQGHGFKDHSWGQMNWWNFAVTLVKFPDWLFSMLNHSGYFTKVQCFCWSKIGVLKFITVFKNKILSCRRGTALQGALVLAESGRLELRDNILRMVQVTINHCDIIGLRSYRIQWKKKRKIMAIKPFKVIEVGTNRKPVCDFLLVINSNWHPLSYRFWVITVYYSNFGRCVFSPLWGGGLGTTYDVHLGLIEKRVVDFLLVLIELFSLGVTAEALRAKIDRKSAISLQRGQFDPKFQVEGVAPSIIFARIVRPMNALQLCRWHFSHKETL